MDIERIVADIKRDEGFSPNAYWDMSRWSIGYGTLALGESSVISHKEAEAALMDALQEAIKDFETIFAGCRDIISDERAEVLIELLYNIGKPRFLSFKRMIHFVRLGKWMEAAYELQDSKWFKDDLKANVRARRFVRQLATGKREVQP